MSQTKEPMWKSTLNQPAPALLLLTPPTHTSLWGVCVCMWGDSLGWPWLLLLENSQHGVGCSRGELFTRPMWWKLCPTLKGSAGYDNMEARHGGDDNPAVVSKYGGGLAWADICISTHTEPRRLFLCSSRDVLCSLICACSHTTSDSLSLH